MDYGIVEIEILANHKDAHAAIIYCIDNQH